MNKEIGIKLLILLTLAQVLLTGCQNNNSDNDINYFVKPPSLDIIIDNKAFPVQISTASWSYEQEDGSLSVANEGSSMTVMEMTDNQTAIEAKPSSKLLLNFCLEPTNYSVYSLTDEGETIIEITDNVITLPSEKGTYIYEIRGIWDGENSSEAGEVNYVLKILIN